MFYITGNDLWRILKSVQDKKLILYGTGVYANEVIKKLQCLDIEVAYCVDDDFSNIEVSIEIRDVYSLLLEKEDFYVFIAKKDRKKCAVMLQEIGLKFYQDFNSIVNARAMHPFIDEFLLDVHLGYTLPFQETVGKGVKIYGDINTAKYTIAILGGSTSDPCNYPWKSWGELLWEYHKKDWAVVVGAVAGYSSSEEVIKLIRDIIPIRPNLIISYSGVNDPLYQYPYVNNYQRFLYNKLCRLKVKDAYGASTIGEQVCYGVTSEISYAERWINNQRIMHSIAKEFDIEYKAFFQPTLYTKCRGESDEEVFLYAEHVGLSDRILYTQQVIEYIKELDLDFIKDATCWLDDYDGLFYDCVHVEELGNKYIAEKIYKYFFERKDEE